MKFKIKFLCSLLFGFICLHDTAAQSVEYNGHFNEIVKLVKSRYMDSVNIDSMIMEMVNTYLNQTEILYTTLLQTIKEKENELPEEERIIYSDKDLLTAKENIENLLRAYLAFEIWGNEGLYRIKNANDPDINAAMKEF